MDIDNQELMNQLKEEYLSRNAYIKFEYIGDDKDPKEKTTPYTKIEIKNVGIIGIGKLILSLRQSADYLEEQHPLAKLFTTLYHVESKTFKHSQNEDQNKGN